MMLPVSLTADRLSKSYNKIQLFDDWSCEFRESHIIGITGPNGSGKSTLLKILSGIVKPDKGNVTFRIGDEIIGEGDYYKHFGFVSPYMNLYTELTLKEHFKLLSKLKGCELNYHKFDKLLEKFDLSSFLDNPIKVFSSGMLQKSKLILALVSQPDVLFLDEPFTNLDEVSINNTASLISSPDKSRIIIIASNDSRELKLCQNVFVL